LSQFTAELKKFKGILQDPKVVLRVAGYEIPVDLFKFLKRQFDETEDVLIYILLGYFSYDNQELLVRLTSYLGFILEYSEDEIYGADEWLNHEIEKGDGWMEPEESINRYVQEGIGRLSCYIQIYPDRLEHQYISYYHFELQINFAHIITDLGHKSTSFTKFMATYFAFESIILFKRELVKQCQNDKKLIDNIKKEGFIGVFEVLDEEEIKAWKEVFSDDNKYLNQSPIARWIADFFKECVEMDVFGHVIILRLSRSYLNHDHKLKLLDLLHYFTYLEILNLNGENSLREVPESIKGLENLKILRIAQTGVESLPSFLNEMKSLKRLDLGTRFLGEPEKRRKFLAPLRTKNIEIHIYAKLGMKGMVFTMDEIFEKN